MEEKEFLTKKQIKELNEELEELKNVKRKEVIEELKIARSYGDLSENAEYDAARNKQSEIEGRIFEIENLLKKTDIIDEKQKHNFINVGSSIEVEIKGEGKKTFDIGVEGKGITITSHSPFGIAVIGRKVDDTVSVDTPNGVKKLKILKIL